jgi:dihydroxyacid dehydratase/phosphogluconate dehydratase
MGAIAKKVGLGDILGAWSHYVVAAGSHTTAGGDANESITVSGITSSDIAIVVLHTKGATPRTILTSQAGTDAIAVEMSGDPSTDHVLKYMVIRTQA